MVAIVHVSEIGGDGNDCCVGHDFLSFFGDKSDIGGIIYMTLGTYGCMLFST